jgi:hypothetical protein
MQASDQVWQQRMLPLMAQLLIGLTTFFFVVSLVQLTYLHSTIRRAPAMDLAPAFAAIDSTPPASDTDRLRVAQLKTLAILDVGTTQRRYHQVNAALMARIWKGYMGFVTGMILSLLGAGFILGKLREPADGISSQRRVSPGLIMIGLGVALMITTIVVNHRIDVTDASGYLRTFDAGDTPAGEYQLPAEPPAPPPAPGTAPSKP